MQPENPPAFPALDFIVPSDLEAQHVHRLGQVRGMSLRDYFAGQALHAAADAVCDDLSDPERDGPAHAARHARAAYLLADAMLTERGK